MAWVKNKKVGAPVFKEIADAAGQAGAAVNTLAGALALASAALDVAKLFVQENIDPFAAAFQEVINQLEDLNNDLFGTGVYLLTINQLDVPGARRQDDFGVPMLFPREALRMAMESFDDPGDPNRPQFSNSAQVCAFGFLATAPSIVGLIDLINALLNVFNIFEWELIKNRLQRATLTPSPASAYPDWRSVRLNSIPQMKLLQDSVNRLLETCRGLGAVVDAIHDVIDCIDQKVDDATAIVNALKANLAALQAAAKASGLYILDVPPQIGGNEFLKDQIFDCNLAIAQTPYTICGIFVGGGPSLVPVDNIRKTIIL
jgi:hypothetical protein